MKVKLSEKAYLKQNVREETCVLVNYDNVKLQGEIVNVVANEFEGNVMHKSRNTFQKWPQREDKILNPQKLQVLGFSLFQDI